MKDLRSKEHYCYKIYTLLMGSCVPPSYRQPPSYIDYSPHFYIPFYRQPPKWIIPICTRNSGTPFYNFSKILILYI